MFISLLIYIYQIILLLIIFFYRFDDVFGSICKDARQIVDTHSVSRVGISDSASHLIWRLVLLLQLL